MIIIQNILKKENVFSKLVYNQTIGLDRSTYETKQSTFRRICRV